MCCCSILGPIRWDGGVLGSFEACLDRALAREFSNFKESSVASLSPHLWQLSDLISTPENAPTNVLSLDVSGLLTAPAFADQRIANAGGMVESNMA